MLFPEGGDARGACRAVFAMEGGDFGTDLVVTCYASGEASMIDAVCGSWVVLGSIDGMASHEGGGEEEEEEGGDGLDHGHGAHGSMCTTGGSSGTISAD